MRASGFLFATLCVAFLNPTYSYGQSGEHGQGGEQHRSEEQSEPYHKHHDSRHGHDHVYPDRGAIVRDLPRGTIGVNYAGVSYRYHDGIWLEPRGPAFMVVAPPIGLVVPTLPTFSTTVAHGGETYLYVNDTYYRPRPDLAGYEVVNDPAEGPAPAPTGPDALVGGQLPGAAQAAAPTTAVIAAGIPTSGPGSAATAPVSGQAATGPIATQAAAFPPPASGATSAASTPVTTAGSTVAAAAVPVTLAAGSASGSSSGPQKGPKVFLYPKNGQTSDQQARDRYDCYRFAVAQSGFDPMRSPGGAPPGSGSEPQSDYERAQSACFEARGYASR
jgi:hypothetical protein